MWYPLLFLLAPTGVGIISSETRDILHVVLDLCAKCLYGPLSPRALARTNACAHAHSPTRALARYEPLPWQQHRFAATDCIL